jgi:FAD/FMN-containing dehydrogenase
VIVVGPAVVLALERIRRHYERIHREIDVPLALRTSPLRTPLAIVPVEGWNRPAEKALRFALQLTDDVIAVHIGVLPEDRERLERVWDEKVCGPARASAQPAPRLEVIESPYRRIYEPIVEFVRRTERERPGQLIALVVPELAGPRWYEALLHNVYDAGFKTALYQGAGERTVVIYIPWYLREGE